MFLDVLRPLKITSIVVTPLPTAVAFPAASINMTAGFVLDQKGIGPDGGTPSPSSTLIENDNVSPIRIVSTGGEIWTESTGANIDCWVDSRGVVGPVGVVAGESEQLRQMAAMIDAGIARITPMFTTPSGLKASSEWAVATMLWSAVQPVSALRAQRPQIDTLASSYAVHVVQ